MKSPIVLLRSLWQDIQRLEPGVKGLERDFVTLENRFAHEGYGFLSITLPKLCDAIIDGITTHRFSCPAGFKTGGQAIPKFLSGMLSEVFEPSSGQLREDPNIGIIKLLREVLYLFKKTQLSDQVNLKLHEKAVAEFFDNDDLIKDLEIDPRKEDLIKRVASLLLPNLETRDFETIGYKHGPGAVYEGLKGNQKWRFLYEALTSKGFDADFYGYANFVYMSKGLQALEHDEMSRVEKSGSNVSGPSNNTARLVTVPKNSTSVRTITVEPVLKQFLQQGLNIVLREEILKCAILQQCLALSDQEQNQKLALEGSLTRYWSTIDLKSASDLLSLKLVDLCFRNHPGFYQRMINSRSGFVAEGNVPRELSKFAGMGNALTFPVQSTVFAIVAMAAICDALGKKPTHQVLKRVVRHIRVYGDDIIIGGQYAHQVVSWLESVGLKVNRRKSFLEGNFRESCGVDAYKGVEITPLYLRHRPDNASVEPKAIAHLVSFSNQAWLRGLYSMSTCVKNEVEQRLRKRLPLVSRHSEALGWESRQETYTPARWNRRLMRFEIKSYVLVPLKRKDKLDDYPALLKWFHSCSENEPGRLDYLYPLAKNERHLLESEMRYRIRLRQKWVPV